MSVLDEMQPFIEQPEFLLEPKSSLIFENQPIRLQCKAVRSRQIFFNCDNKWLSEQEHIKSTETNVRLNYLTSIEWLFFLQDKGQIIIITTIQLTSEQVESNPYKCFCQAWSATGGTLKSRTANIELACKCLYTR